MVKPTKSTLEGGLILNKVKAIYGIFVVLMLVFVIGQILFRN